MLLHSILSCHQEYEYIKYHNFENENGAIRNYFLNSSLLVALKIVKRGYSTPVWLFCDWIIIRASQYLDLAPL